MEIISAFLPLIIMVVLMYFMIIRPQQKQAKQKQDMLDAMAPGDAVVTIGGLHGIVHAVQSDARLVEIDCEGVILTFQIEAISRVNKQADQVARVEELSPDAVEVIEEEAIVELDEENNQ